MLHTIKVRTVIFSLRPAGRMPDITVSDSTGGEEEGGRMSSVRRTFCLFVTFDLGLMFILWVIYTQVSKENKQNKQNKTHHKNLFMYHI